MSPSLHIVYDRCSDVLYLSTRTKSYAYSSEERPGVVWRYDMKDNSVIGVTIIDYSSYWCPRISDLIREISSRLSMPESHIKDELSKVK